MVEVGANPVSKKLIISYSHGEQRCFVETGLLDSEEGRLTADGLAFRIEKALNAGTFNLADFPALATPVGYAGRRSALEHANTAVPTLADFSREWFAENSLVWRPSYVATTRLTLDGRIIPALGHKRVDAITRADLLAFRSGLIRTDPVSGKTIAASRINHIMTPLRMMLEEAASRHEFLSPFRGIKPLRLPRTDVNPLSLDDIRDLLAVASQKWKSYLAIKIFTGLRSGEINGLEWKHVDLSNDIVKVRQAIVGNQVQDTKTAASTRDIPMTGYVRGAFLTQRKIANSERWVFTNRDGNPIDLVNFTNRVWHPLLERAGLEPRRPYQTRHTAATLMLASGENPEWVARVLGHSTTEMLFTVYSRYIPNLTRMDGNAFSALVAQAFGDTQGQVEGGQPIGLTSMSRNELERLVAAVQQNAQTICFPDPSDRTSQHRRKA